jgi:NTP pyrophosphatase (non-canonical NTP hydrolase)
METQVKQTDDHQIDEELADVLTAISVVSKRLARKLTMLSRREKEKMKGEESDE